MSDERKKGDRLGEIEARVASLEGRVKALETPAPSAASFEFVEFPERDPPWINDLLDEEIQRNPDPISTFQSTQNLDIFMDGDE